MKKSTKPFILITGMHRSGTSFLVRALNIRGIYLGKESDLISDEWRPVYDNLRGHWENDKFFGLTLETLSSNNGTWDKVPEKISITKDIGKQIELNVSELLQNQTLGAAIKDPRLILCLESWIEFLPKNFLIVAIFRNPLKVAESLKKRNGFNYEKSINLWNFYNEKLLNLLDNYDGFLLNFDWSKTKLISEINLLCENLGLPTDNDLSDWYSNDLKHSDLSFDKKYTLEDSTLSILSKLNKRANYNNFKSRELGSHDAKELQHTVNNLLKERYDLGDSFKKINQINLKQLEKNLTTISNLEFSLKTTEQQKMELESSLKTTEQQKMELESSLKTTEQQKMELESSLKTTEQQKRVLELSIKEKEEKLSELKSSLIDKELQISKIQNFQDKLQKDLDSIHESFTWKTLQKLGFFKK